MPEDSAFTDRLPLSRSTLDRDAAARDEPGVIETAWADPATRVAVLAGDRALLAPGGSLRLALLPPAAVPEPELLVLLGRTTEDEGDVPAGTRILGAVIGDAAAIAPDEDRWADLRLQGAVLDARDTGMFAQLLGLAHWHRASAFSPRSGAATVPGRAGWVRHPVGSEAEASGQHVFPRTDAAVIVGVIDPADRLLLASNIGWPEHVFSVVAGFVEPGESFESAVRREVQEETAVRVGRVRYLGSQPWPFPASVMVGFHAWAQDGTDPVPDRTEIREARWFSRAELHAEIAAGLRLPGSTSIARALIEEWSGEPLGGAM